MIGHRDGQQIIVCDWCLRPAPGARAAGARFPMARFFTEGRGGVQALQAAHVCAACVGDPANRDVVDGRAVLLPPRSAPSFPLAAGEA